MQIWRYVILAGDRTLKTSERVYITQLEALRAGVKFIQDNQSMVKDAEPDSLKVATLPEMVERS